VLRAFAVKEIHREDFGEEKSFPASKGF